MTAAVYEAPTDGAMVQYNGGPGRSTAALIEWAQAADAAHRVALMLCKTSFVPDEFRNKPHETAAAILAGDEVGFSPMASLNAFHIIKGRAAANALALRAICQSVGHEFDLVESTERRVVMRARRYGTDHWQTVTWTIERAQKLGYLTRDQWRKQPQAMLVARVTSESARLVGADAIMGIPYSYEELLDDVDVTGTVEGTASVTSAAPAPPTRRRRATTPRTPARAVSGPMPAADQPAGPVGRPPLPGEDTSAETVEPTTRLTEQQGGPPNDAEFYRDEAAMIHEVLDEHADEIVADMVDQDAPTTRPEEDEAYDPTEPDVAPAETPDATDEPPRKPVDMKRLFAMLRDAEVGDRHVYASGVLGKTITSYSQLSAEDVATLVENLKEIIAEDDDGNGE